jgi:hypothetical protein
MESGAADDATCGLFVLYFLRAAQDAEFQDYAVKLVERVRAEGKNPLPIILQLQKNMRQSLAG